MNQSKYLGKLEYCDYIRIEELEVYANHGVYPEENKLGQKFLISAQLFMDIRRAGQDDNVTEFVNYGEVCHFIHTYMKEHTFALIETVAEKLAEAILLHFKKLEGISIEIKKPWAPIGLPVQCVSVHITRLWHNAYIALGSNLGEREEYLQNAVEALDKREDTRVELISDFIETKPYGDVEQDDFLNGMIKLRTLLSPEELLFVLHQIEAAALRERTVRWGPRTLDLDIILYDDLVMDSKDLTIPHLDMQNRRFVLEPLVQIAPFVRHPILNQTMAQLLKQCPEQCTDHLSD
ncbi:MAG: 2-amino-4-hydroxy-6-hydroxymethyldihydropteridine diphosphokinase [Clostridia bacterium]|nr:2-amino-4-hydroxy-6-hydroxymethyldihydropteridine diphosphokinase [Clostridia bacterium]